MSIETNVKNEFNKIFRKKDWKLFKGTAEFYFYIAAILKRKDIPQQFNNDLLFRNIQKRLFLGLGSELILKALYLKSGYYINKLSDQIDCRSPYKFEDVPEHCFDPNETITLGNLSQQFKTIQHFENEKVIERGFKIAKVYRNKEAHAVTGKHTFLKENYKDIQNGLIEFYKVAFHEIIEFEISMTPNQTGQFKIIEKLV